VTSLTGRYTGSFEGAMESDIARLREVKDAKDFVEFLEGIIRDVLTDNFWSITLPNRLATSASRSPALFAYHAALNILDAYVLFSRIKISELSDPVVKGTKSAIERHHLFPKKYLQKIGITEITDINQIANYAFIEWPDNVDISDLPPAVYFSNYMERMSPQMQYWHAIPDRWENMDYNEFLRKRRKLIARVIKDGFDALSSTEQKLPTLMIDPPLDELIRQGESNTIEFKSSMVWDHQRNQPSSDNTVPLSIVKTIAAFMNSDGGNLIVGVDDEGNVLGIENDYEVFKERKDWDGWSQHLVNILRKNIGVEIMTFLRLERLEHGGKTIAKIQVDKSPKPIYVEYKDNKGQDRTEFFVRAVNTTQTLNTKQANDYIRVRWKEG